jgi:SAM-dependent methyltransferase
VLKPRLGRGQRENEEIEKSAMRNRESWKESKFVFRKGRLVASSDINDVSIGSRLVATLVAGRYQEAFAQRASGRVLDLGCGKVPLYICYAASATDVTCVDWANSMHGNQHIDSQVDLSAPLPFADRQFDTIILSDVLEHVPVPELVWREMARILADKGRVLMNVPFYYCLHEQPHDYYRYTEFALRRFAQSAGMRIVELTPIGGAPEILADIFAKTLRRVPKIGGALARSIQSATLAAIHTSFGRRISSATAREFPFGYFMIAEKT